MVADAPLVINQRGIGYKNFIPATFGSPTAARFSTRSHMQLKHTRLHPRIPKNAPKAYERAVLKRGVTPERRAMKRRTLIETTQEDTLLSMLTPVMYQPAA